MNSLQNLFVARVSRPIHAFLLVKFSKCNVNFWTSLFCCDDFQLKHHNIILVTLCQSCHTLNHATPCNIMSHTTCHTLSHHHTVSYFYLDSNNSISSHLSLMCLTNLCTQQCFLEINKYMDNKSSNFKVWKQQSKQIWQLELQRNDLPRRWRLYID